MDIIYGIAGLILLLVGGDGAVRYGVSLAKKLRVSPLLIGLTIISIGTSLPEAVVSAQAMLDGSPDIAVGNIVGSNIANILLMIGVAGLVAPIVVDRTSVRRDGAGMLAATGLFAILGYAHWMGVPAGIFMIAGLVSILAKAYLQEREDPEHATHTAEVEEFGAPQKSMGFYLLMSLGSILAIILGADMFVSGAVNIARVAGVPETVIGLTMVALGTSLPELATVIPAARKGHSDVIMGNIIGSNTFNVLAVGGVANLIAPLEVAPSVLAFDLPVMLGISVVFVLACLRLKKIPRGLAALFLLLYVGYVGYQYLAA